jgi:hypothetical protein
VPTHGAVRSSASGAARIEDDVGVRRHKEEKNVGQGLVEKDEGIKHERSEKDEGVGHGRGMETGVGMVARTAWHRC